VAPVAAVGTGRRARTESPGGEELVHEGAACAKPLAAVGGRLSPAPIASMSAVPSPESPTARGAAADAADGASCGENGAHDGRDEGSARASPVHMAAELTSYPSFTSPKTRSRKPLAQSMQRRRSRTGSNGSSRSNSSELPLPQVHPTAATQSAVGASTRGSPTHANPDDAAAAWSVTPEPTGRGQASATPPDGVTVAQAVNSGTPSSLTASLERRSLLGMRRDSAKANDDVVANLSQSVDKPGSGLTSFGKASGARASDSSAPSIRRPPPPSLGERSDALR